MNFFSFIGEGVIFKVYFIFCIVKFDLILADDFEGFDL